MNSDYWALAAMAMFLLFIGYAITLMAQGEQGERCELLRQAHYANVDLPADWHARAVRLCSIK